MLNQVNPLKRYWVEIGWISLNQLGGQCLILAKMSNNIISNVEKLIIVRKSFRSSRKSCPKVNNDYSQLSVAKT